MHGAAQRALAAVARRSAPGRVAALGVDVHFHPDASHVDGASVLSSIVAVGRWRSQFETGTSNGGLTARPGGDRWRWESRLFDGAYDGSPAEQRPAYGGLRTSDDPYGSAPRFGSAFLRVDPSVLGRVTICYPDSTFEPEAVGTPTAAGAVLDVLRTTPMQDPLDRYIEAHVHGGIRLEDVEALVLDPSHRGTTVEEAARSLGRPLEWHPGYRLEVEGLRRSDSYRGPQHVRAAERVAVDGALTPAVLDRARRSGALDADGAKRVWHLMARFGRLDGAAGAPGG